MSAAIRDAASNRLTVCLANKGPGRPVTITNADQGELTNLAERSSILDIILNCRGAVDRPGATTAEFWQAEHSTGIHRVLVILTRCRLQLTPLIWLISFVVSLALIVGPAQGADSLDDDSFVYWGSDQEFKQLVLNGADVNSPGASGRTPLFVAVEYGSPGKVQILLDAGASVDSPNKDGNTALWRAVLPNDLSTTTEKIEILIRAGAKVNGLPGSEGIPLHAAIRVENEDAVKALIKAGADLNLKARGGFDALSLAKMKHTTGPIVNLITTAISQQSPGDEDQQVGLAGQSNFMKRVGGKKFVGKYTSDNSSDVMAEFGPGGNVFLTDSGIGENGAWTCVGTGSLKKEYDDFTEYDYTLGTNSSANCVKEALLQFTPSDVEGHLSMSMSWKGDKPSQSFRLYAALDDISIVAGADVAALVDERLVAVDAKVLRLTPQTTDFWTFLSILVRSGRDIADLSRKTSIPQSGDQFQDKRNRKKFEDTIVNSAQQLQNSYSDIEFLLTGIKPVIMDYDFDRNVQPVCVPDFMFVAQDYEMYSGPQLQFAWNRKVDVIGGCGVGGGGVELSNGNRIISGRVLEIPLANVDAGERFNNLLRGGFLMDFLCSGAQYIANETLACVPTAIRIKKIDGTVIFSRVYYKERWLDKVVQ